MDWIQALDEALDELGAGSLPESKEIDAEIFYAKWLTSAMENNPSLEAVLKLERMLPVEGNTSVEVFAGAASMTLGLRMAKVPAMIPWDRETDERLDVTTNGILLIELVRLGFLVFVWMGTPCQSQTLARDPALRDWQTPWGKHCLSKSQRKLVELGNILFLFSAWIAICLHENKGYFAIENPMKSWLWVLAWQSGFAQQVGLRFVHFRMMEYGALYSKWTVVGHNVPGLSRLFKPVQDASQMVLRGMVWWHGQLVFLTHLACAYPPALGACAGSYVAEALKERQRCLDQGEEVKFETLEACMGNPMIHNAPVLCPKVEDPFDQIAADPRKFCSDEGQ